MRVTRPFSITLGLVLMLAMATPSWSAPGTLFSGMTLIDEINCGNPSDPHPFQQSAAGVSQIQTILGQPCRVMPNTGATKKYFSYKIGEGKGLVAGKAYFLVVDYPEDLGRTITVINAGCETTETFHTGRTIGDGRVSPYGGLGVAESINYPLSGQYETWQQLFFLHDKYFGISEGGTRNQLPANGFWVTIYQLTQDDDPVSNGAAVKRIALYEAPSQATYTMPMNLPPLGLPRRHVFWREEMSDQVISTDSNRGVTNRMDWYEFKAKLMKFLAINTFSKDLLEFGACQGWDSSKYGGNNWVFYNYDARNDWKNCVNMMTSYGFDLLPYYEYCGSKGYSGFGNRKYARPLTDTNATLDYTQITWTEVANADLTHPGTFTDLWRMLDCTIFDLEAGNRFVGAWLRNRPSQLPISFSDDAIAQFSAEANGGVAVTRAQLQASTALRNDYYAWWYERRKQFFIQVRDALVERGAPESVFLYTVDTSEGGWTRPYVSASVITDSVSTWTPLVSSVMSLNEALTSQYHYYAMTMMRSTYNPWEWHHSSPPMDPARYQDTDGIVFTVSNRGLYSMSSPAVLSALTYPSGLAIVRTYFLNELSESDSGGVGYYVSDRNVAGPYGMLAEARAVANGDPWYIGYMTSSNYNRGFPQYVRNFNAAYLALPALPSTVMNGVANHASVVVRKIETDGFGTYYAVVNTGLINTGGVVLTLPAPPTSGSLTNLVTGEAMINYGSMVIIPDLYPGQLLALRDFSGNQPPGVEAGDNQMIVYPANTVNLDATVEDDGGIASVTWSKTSGPGTVTFGNPNAVDTTATFSQTGTYVLRLTASDGSLTRYDEMTVKVVGIPPTVNAGADQTVYEPQATAYLQGVATDDGSPSPLVTTWSKTTGPGTVTFGDIHALQTTATFSAKGYYILRLTATDGADTVFDELVVMVKEAPPYLEVQATNVGGGLKGYAFKIRNGDGQLQSYALTVAFEAMDTASIRQVKAFGAVRVDREEDANTYGAMPAANYVKVEDTWVFSPFSNNGIPGISPLNGATFTGFVEGPNNAYYMISAGSGSGSALGDNVSAVYVVSDGNISWTGVLARLGTSYPVTGNTVPDLCGNCAYGDYNGDGYVDLADYTVWADNYGQSGSEHIHGDGNYDGVVDLADYTIWADHYGQSVSMSMAMTAGDESLTFTPMVPPIEGGASVGDFNGDGIVDAADYTLWADGDASADANGDGVVDLADYTIWSDNLGAGLIK